MEDMFPDILHPYPTRPRSKSLGNIDDRQSSPTALEPAQRYATSYHERSRSAHGRLLPIFDEVPSTYDKPLVNINSHEDISSTTRETQQDSIETIHDEASLPITDGDNEDSQGENSWSPNNSDSSSQDQDTSFWSNATGPYSPSTPSSPAAHTEPPIPLPAPNTLTSTYLPFSSHLALTNHFTPSTLHSFVCTPIFLHSMLQLPCTLSTLLNLRTSEIVCRLTPTILLNHTTHLDPESLLPSLATSTPFSTYHHVQGLLYFPENAAVAKKIGELFAIHHKANLEMRKVWVQVVDTEGKRHDVAAWAWVADAAEGEEQWWALEEFVAGRVVGFGSVEW